MTPTIVFCRDPLEPSRPDRAFEAEVAAVETLGLPTLLVDHDALVRGEGADRFARRIEAAATPILAIYRGWMVTLDQYRLLYEALSARAIRLINDPGQYRHAHLLPENEPVLRGYTPRTVWLAGDLGMDRVLEALLPFGDAPVIVKDFVKSRKHEWAEACFIPSASDRAAVERVVGRFLELQGDDLNVGLVFREFVELEPVGTHPGSGMPLAEEYRAFWLDGRLLSWSAYWPEGRYDRPDPPWERFAGVAGAVRSRFFTMDVARRRDGRWTILELGDGQVSGLPTDADAGPFYQALLERRPVDLLPTPSKS
ncbi:hypothetical protein OJF2_33490 [Aquisphaera giovannonii]|uniref:ATP-grasp domain-containing protein n=1 Tax=Aquisphaera giovannonii TaxID=406548 RepID=A0A5B9W2J7_9BACT|nr:ATP-grasp domain-containing protein [Aquisphaera giovannonii]QEH34806.1 hypothetical protein OJF2_33490 [Aquisphaera giovannonii]